jgi:hypothetical protein
MGAVVVYGSIYFGVIAAPAEVRPIDWVIVAWALAMGLAFLAVAARLGSGEAGVRRFALRLLAC